MTPFRTAMLGLLAALLVGACDFWPEELDTLAESISRDVSGATTAWLLGGDVVVINIEGSPLYGEDPAVLEAAALDLATQTVALSSATLESIVVTFFEEELTDDPEKLQEFIFLVLDGRPVLQALPDFEATGPLTGDELQAAVDRLGESLAPETGECVLAAMERGARAAGDPETLDPENVELLPADNWRLLDAFGRRLILSQVLATQALIDCSGE